MNTLYRLTQISTPIKLIGAFFFVNLKPKINSEHKTFKN